MSTPTPALPSDFAALGQNEKRAYIQDLVLAAVAGQRVAGAAVSMSIGKTLIGLRDMVRITQQGTKHPVWAVDGESFFLVVAPKQSILDSWVSEAKKFGLEYLLPFIDFTTYLSMGKKLVRRRYHKVYLDECHSLKQSHAIYLMQHLAAGGAILGVTGTPPKATYSEKGRLVAKFCPILIDYTVNEAVEAGILNDYRIVVHRLRLSAEKTLQITTKKKSWLSSEVQDYRSKTGAIGNAQDKKTEMMLRILRMQALMKYPTKVAYAQELAAQFGERKVLIFANFKEQAAQFCPHTYVSGGKFNDVNLQLFNSGEIKRLSCVAQLSEGINIKNLETLIILHAYGNERRASQRIGRGLRLNPTETATAHVLMYEGTVDEEWVRKALEDFDQHKVIYVDHQF